MRSAARETWAAASALAAYLTTVLPRARRELRELGPLPPGKRANAEAVAVFATLAPRRARPLVVRAITQLQVAIDLRDELEEQASGGKSDDALLARLDASWRAEAATLPAYPAVADLLDRAVSRCEEGQRQTHAAAAGNTEALRKWALTLGAPADYRWWEVAAGATSSVAAHALIAAAADPATTPGIAALIDAAYQPSVGALTVFLDDLIDREEDRATGEHDYLAYYESIDAAAGQLGSMARDSRLLMGPLPHSDRHRAIVAGVAGYYLSSPAAADPDVMAIREQLLEAVGPATRLLGGFARLRRLAESKRPGQAGNSPGP